MSLKKIICLDFTGAELESNYWNEFDSLAGQRVNVARDGLADHSDADVLLVKLGAKVDKFLIDSLPGLKYIGMLGTGYGGIDTDYAATKGITVTNIADYATQSVAEFILGILLEHLRDISKARRQANQGDYSDNFTGSELKGKKFGVIGMGNIGKRTAELAHALGAEVSYWSRNRKDAVEAQGVPYCELDELLSSSDIITLNVALNSETEGIINAERINAIKPGAILVNTSPMELVDFEALVARLKQNDMIFMLDHSDEMTQEQLSAVQPLDNCIVYPAIAYLSREAGQLKKRIYVDNLKNFVAGNPTNKVN